MTEYRKISQEYAKGAINAAILVNGGAAVAVLAQIELVISLSVRIALGVWAFGILAGAATWILAFLSTRFVDKSYREIAASSSQTTGPASPVHWRRFRRHKAVAYPRNSQNNH